ncbi:hypothetical protein CVT25_003407 [Psilocybe cyanescens]|uniref:DUF6534 domain-containing protein n=1 Tax=Psilocybe cyanescens TaxID=93625 RepID=A0A409WLY1_PSICY|nr:hypothetical protein CVT25_003407 [Psilocybe cyanescens]
MATQTAIAHIDTTFGAAYIGVVAAGVLYGVSFVQAWYYFLKYQQDVWYIKSLVGSPSISHASARISCVRIQVGAVWAFETVHQALISHTVYQYVITNYNNPGSLEYIVWSVLVSNHQSHTASFLSIIPKARSTVQWSYRVVGPGLSHLTSMDVYAFVVALLSFLVNRFIGLSMAVNLLGAVTDVAIAAALFVFLHRSRTGFKKSDTMISKLIAFTVSTGLLTSICAVASLVSILASGNTLIYVAFYFSLGRLYSNSVLATLNARQTIRKLGEDSDELSFSLQSLAKSGQRNPNSARSTNISIKIDTMHDYIREHATDVAEPESAATERSF